MRSGLPEEHVLSVTADSILAIIGFYYSIVSLKKILIPEFSDPQEYYGDGRDSAIKNVTFLRTANIRLVAGGWGTQTI